MDRRNRFFWKGKDNNEDVARTSQELRNMIAFRQLNLMGSWPFRGKLDVIFCRNVMIYFDKTSRAKLPPLGGPTTNEQRERKKMSQAVKSTKIEKNVTITLNGRFDFAVHDEFRRAYEELVEPGSAVVIDMRGVEYMDSSALGMLLLLREHAGEESANIQIDHCNVDVKNILKISNFEKLFKIG